MERQEITEVTRSEAAALRKELQQASSASDEAWWKQCTLLHKVYYTGVGGELKPVYELWGHESFHDYVESELGIHVGTANGMVRTARFFLVKMKGAFRQKEHLLSRQRMRALAAHPDKVEAKNLNYWVTQARNMTVCQLEHKLEGRKEHVKTLSLSLSADAHAALSEALKELMDTGEYASRGDALLSILRPNSRRKTA